MSTGQRHFFRDEEKLFLMNFYRVLIKGIYRVTIIFDYQQLTNDE